MAEIVGKASRNNSQVYDINPYRFAFLVDREGSVWIGDQKGVHRFSYSPLMELALPTNVDAFALVPDQGGVVWVSAGNRNGSSNLYRVAGGRGELQKSLANFAYRAGDKTLWFGGERRAVAFG
jgi:ligand-binding sensor domain-containing protein